MKRLFAYRPSRKQMIKAMAVSVITGVIVMPMLASAKDVLIDVRTPEEYQVGHPNGAINISHNNIATSIASKGISKQDSIKLYSRNGNRADLAKAALQSAGYTKVEVSQ